MDNGEIDNKNLVLGKFIGKGAYGDVFCAVWRGDDVDEEGIEVAVKVIRMVSIPKKDILREFRLLKSLNHKHVLRVFGYSVRDDAIQIVTDLMDGNVRLLLETVKLRLSSRMEIIRKMIDATDYLHSENLIHRDIKSSNFLHKNKGEKIVVCDFGLASTMMKSVSVYESGKTLKGSVPWIAPELLTIKKSGKVEYAKKSDIYALGVTIWEVLTQRLPYATVLQPQLILHLVKTGDLRITSEFNEDDEKMIPREIRQLVYWCCDRDPRKRPTTGDLIQWYERKDELLKRIIKSEEDRNEKDQEEVEGETEVKIANTTNRSTGGKVVGVFRSLGSGAIKIAKVVFNQYVSDDAPKEDPDENM